MFSLIKIITSPRICNFSLIKAFYAIWTYYKLKKLFPTYLNFEIQSANKVWYPYPQDPTEHKNEYYFFVDIRCELNVPPEWSYLSWYVFAYIDKNGVINSSEIKDNIDIISNEIKNKVPNSISVMRHISIESILK